jgi:hypothetical protein
VFEDEAPRLSDNTEVKPTKETNKPADNTEAKPAEKAKPADIGIEPTFIIKTGKYEITLKDGRKAIWFEKYN